MKKQTLPIGLIVLALALTSCGADGAPQAAQPPGEAVAAARAVVELLVRGDFAAIEQRFDAKMRSGLTRDGLAEAWRQVVVLAGPFKQQLSAQDSQLQGHDVVLVLCEFEKAVLGVRVVMNGEGQIAGLFIEPQK